MLLEVGAIILGMLVSFFLKDINFLSLNFIYPDFLLIFIVYFALRRGEFAGIWIGFAAGLLEDSNILAFSSSQGKYVPVIGTHMLVYCLTGYLLGRFNRIIDRHSMIPIIVVVFVTTLLVRIQVWLVSFVLLQEVNRNYSFLATSVYTALLAPVWFWLLNWVYRYSQEVEKE